MSALSLFDPHVRDLAQRQPRAAELFGKSTAEQQRLGYFHTLREICQQPATWIETCQLMRNWALKLTPILDGASSIVLTGSGSSEYAGDCVRAVLQAELEAVTQACGAGSLLIHGSKALAVGRPVVLVSLARSGNSPESVGALTLLLRKEPEIRHLVLTCNASGELATGFRDEPRVTVVTLDDGTNDRGLVMTSSFTNLVMAARFLGLLKRPQQYQAMCEQASQIASQLIHTYFGVIAEVAAVPFRRAVFLGSGAGFAATHEAALKILEMSAGRVTTLSETYLGLRHGPMSYLHDDTLLVCFLSSDPGVRAYEADLLREVNRKNLGLMKLLVGENVPSDLLRENDVAVECPGLKNLGDENAPVIDVLVGQLLAFFRCLEEGLRPDSPSENGAISRVVESFPLYLDLAQL
jgi:tagatose-6-phosphate ketose/aldose isomerase